MTGLDGHTLPPLGYLRTSETNDFEIENESGDFLWSSICGDRECDNGCGDSVCDNDYVQFGLESRTLAKKYSDSVTFEKNGFCDHCGHFVFTDSDAIPQIIITKLKLWQNFFNAEHIDMDSFAKYLIVIYELIILN
jgi:hypothetical protein